ncbi:MAG: hypothetical protein NW215_03885 [Hyphomicrobiales bacterium]|nr:hypothetical protein [Hyphomicrobiales bacterium]
MTPHLNEGEASGFSLIETIVGLTLLSLVSGVLLSAVLLGRNALRATNVKTDAVVEVMNAQRALRGLIERIQPLRIPDAKRSLRFTGGEKELIFLIDDPLPATTGLYEVAIGGSASARGRVSVRLRQAFASNAKEGDLAWNEMDLLDGVERLSFRYSAGITPGAEWMPEWPADALPSLIQIDMLFAAGDQRIWPALTIHLKLEEAPWR